ncbi:MAG: hypothetical protein LAO78_27695 [Acidobacteriia bacterium]|nr:hypothetical protein [Terriglobia bacterium]
MANSSDSRARGALVISILSLCFAGWSVVESHRNPRLVSRPFIAVTASATGEHDIDFTLLAGGTTAAMNVYVDGFCSYDTHRHWDPDYAKTLPDYSIKQDMYTHFDEKDLLLPGMTKPFHCAAYVPPRPPNAPPPGRAVHSRFIQGLVKYADVYGNNHKTEFCFYHPPLNFSDTLVTCPAFTAAD